MTKETLAKRLNGREIGDEIAQAEEQEAKLAGLVVAFGASDDLMELRGAICDEAGCYDGGDLFLDKEGLVPSERDDRWTDAEMERYLVRKKTARKITAVWCGEDPYSWTFKTDIPHATFEIVEGDEKYCRGIVFELAALPRG